MLRTLPVRSLFLGMPAVFFTSAACKSLLRTSPILKLLFHPPFSARLQGPSTGCRAACRAYSRCWHMLRALWSGSRSTLPG